MDVWLLRFMFWGVTAIAVAIPLAPVSRFLTFGWNVRQQEFVNRLSGAGLQTYLNRFWRNRIKVVEPTGADVDVAVGEFERAYDLITGKHLYVLPLILLILCFLVAGALCVAAGLSMGVEQYAAHYGMMVAKGPALSIFQRQEAARLSIAFVPLPNVFLGVPAVSASAGAYLYATQVCIRGYRTRTLVSSDLLWSSFRIIIAIPLGAAVGELGSPALAGLVSFALGAFPIGTLNKLLRRVAGRAISDAEREDNHDDLLMVNGVTPDVSAQLNEEGIFSPQQLAQADPVSLSIRGGLAFDFVINLAAQGQIWSYLGAASARLAQIGYCDARTVAAVMENDEETRSSIITALATVANMQASLLKEKFKIIARDEYTIFLVDISRSLSSRAQIVNSVKSRIVV